MLIFISILGIGLLILVHELGHFLTAKLFGMRAEKFYIGFPPAAVKKRFGETEYGIGFVPLGGYVKISGMNKEEDLPADVVPRAYYAKPMWQKVIVIAAGAFMNMVLAVLLFAAFYLQGIPEFDSTTTILEVREGSSAAKAGIQPGDRIVAINGFSSDDASQFRDQLRPRADQPVTVTIDREGQVANLTAVLDRSEEGEGVLGVFFDQAQVGTVKLSIPQALRHSFADIGIITKEVFIAMKDVFFSEERREEITSPIGIVAISSKTIELGFGVYLRVLGFISLQLAIFNLLPLLPLDGGHVLFNILEKIKGSPIRREVFERASFAGLAIFATLFVIGVLNDVQRLMGPGFNLQP